MPRCGPCCGRKWSSTASSCATSRPAMLIRSAGWSCTSRRGGSRSRSAASGFRRTGLTSGRCRSPMPTSRSTCGPLVHRRRRTARRRRPGRWRSDSLSWPTPPSACGRHRRLRSWRCACRAAWSSGAWSGWATATSRSAACCSNGANMPTGPLPRRPTLRSRSRRVRRPELPGTMRWSGPLGPSRQPPQRHSRGAC